MFVYFLEVEHMRTLNLLVVDDEELGRLRLSKGLERLLNTTLQTSILHAAGFSGYVILEANGGQQALEIISNQNMILCI
jgi:CheY-like chemotaxis protein